MNTRHSLVEIRPQSKEAVFEKLDSPNGERVVFEVWLHSTSYIELLLKFVLSWFNREQMFQLKVFQKSVLSILVFHAARWSTMFATTRSERKSISWYDRIFECKQRNSTTHQISECVRYWRLYKCSHSKNSCCSWYVAFSNVMFTTKETLASISEHKTFW